MRTIEVNLNQEMTSRLYWGLEMAKVSRKSAREVSFQHILDVFVAFSVQDVGLGLILICDSGLFRSVIWLW